MPVFKYEAMDSSGKKVKGRMEFESRPDLTNYLKEQGLFATTIEVVPFEIVSERNSGQNQKVIKVLAIVLALSLLLAGISGMLSEDRDPSIESKIKPVKQGSRVKPKENTQVPNKVPVKVADTKEDKPEKKKAPALTKTQILMKRLGVAEGLNYFEQDFKWDIVEENSVYFTIAWKATIKNNMNTDMLIDLNAEFYNESGFRIAQDSEYRKSIPSYSQREFNGNALVKNVHRSTIKTMKLKVDIIRPR